MPALLRELERRAETHLSDDPSTAAGVYRETLGGLVPLLRRGQLRQKLERDLAAAGKLAGTTARRQALRSPARWLRERWPEAGS